MTDNKELTLKIENIYEAIFGTQTGSKSLSLENNPIIKNAYENLNDIIGLKEVTKQKHDDWVYGVGFSPDNKHIATACLDNYLRIFEIQYKKR